MINAGQQARLLEPAAMTPLAETIRFLDQVISQTKFEGRPKGVALELTGGGELHLHLCLEEGTDDPEFWSHAYLESEVSQLDTPGWLKEYQQLVRESQDPLQTLDQQERARLRSIPDPPASAEALELLEQPLLYPGVEGAEGAPVMVLFVDAQISPSAHQLIESEPFRKRACEAFRCRRITSESPLFRGHGISNSQLNFYSLQGELLATRWLGPGTFDDLPDFLEQAIVWSQESAAEREERRMLAEQLEAELERRYEEGLELAARALSECKGVFYPARRLVCSDQGVIEVD